MAGTTITSSTTIGLRLTIAGQNPVLVATTGTINVAAAGGQAIFGGYGNPGTITNYGLLNAGGYGIELTSGGRITNGSTANTSAKITGGNYGIRTDINGTGTIKNFGTIASTALATGAGVDTRAKGLITNGATNSIAARISGYYQGVLAQGAGSTVSNFGTIIATGTQTTSSTGSVGVDLAQGGTVTNGSATVKTANISGGIAGVEIDNGAGTVLNFGTIAGTTNAGRGISLDGDGTIANGSAADLAARIIGNGRNAIFAAGNAAISNFGTIIDTGTAAGSGVRVLGTATIINGSASDKTALISAYSAGVSATGANSSVQNFGTILSRGTSNGLGFTSSGIYFANGGTVINGSTADTTARITSPSFAIDIEHAAGTVENFGTIAGNGAAGRGVNLGTGGSVTNGIAGYIGASFRTGVYIGGGAGTVINLGTIKGTSRNAVGLNLGGTVTNGSTADTTALIAGQRIGVYVRADIPSAVNNFGTITGVTSRAVNLYLGGTVINGSATDTVARISSGGGAVFTGAPSTITNFGTIDGTTKSAVSTRGPTTLVNGSTASTAARIVGTTGAYFTSASAITNFGTIDGGTGSALTGQGTMNVVNGAASVTTARITGRHGIYSALALTLSNFGTVAGSTSSAVFMNKGGIITNGNQADLAAVISGGTTQTGVYVAAGATTITNSGTIAGNTAIRFAAAADGTVSNSGTIAAAGTAGTAVQLGGGTDRLIMTPAAVFVGKVDAGAGSDTLELAKTAATGTMSGLGTIFTGFEKLVVDAAAKWNFAGANSVASLKNAGIVTINPGGSLHVTSAVDPASTGTFTIANNATLDVGADTGAGNPITFAGTARLLIDHAASFGTGIGTAGYTGPVLHNFTLSNAIDMKDLLFPGTTETFNVSTGLMQLNVGATAVGTLQFDVSTLGPGNFHITDDTTGHALITLF